MTDPAVVDPLISYEYLQDCARKYLGAVNAADPLASPLYGDLRGLPPLLIQVGTDERLLDDSRQYADRATLAGVSVELEILGGNASRLSTRRRASRKQPGRARPGRSLPLATPSIIAEPSRARAGQSAE